MALPSYALPIPGHLGRQHRWPHPHRLESHRDMPYPPANTKDALGATVNAGGMYVFPEHGFDLRPRSLRRPIGSRSRWIWNG